MANRTKWTPKREKKFLHVLAETVNVSAACKTIGVGRSSAYARKTSDTEFSIRWDEAENIGVDKLELEVRRRALHGTRKGVYYKGELVASERVYSNDLAMFLLEGHRPEKYRKNIKQEITGNGLVLHVVYDPPPKLTDIDNPDPTA